MALLRLNSEHTMAVATATFRLSAWSAVVANVGMSRWSLTNAFTLLLMPLPSLPMIMMPCCGSSLS